MLHGRFNVDQPVRSSRQVVDTLLLAVDLAAVVVFQGEAYTCHREVSWVSAFRYWKAGFDHRVGHLWALRMMSESSNAPFLRCFSAFASHRETNGVADTMIEA